LDGREGRLEKVERSIGSSRCIDGRMRSAQQLASLTLMKDEKKCWKRSVL
jgi:hypothetical protein